MTEHFTRANQRLERLPEGAGDETSWSLADSDESCVLERSGRATEMERGDGLPSASIASRIEERLRGIAWRPHNRVKSGGGPDTGTAHPRVMRDFPRFLRLAGIEARETKWWSITSQSLCQAAEFHVSGRSNSLRDLERSLTDMERSVAGMLEEEEPALVFEFGDDSLLWVNPEAPWPEVWDGAQRKSIEERGRGATIGRTPREIVENDLAAGSLALYIPPTTLEELSESEGPYAECAREAISTAGLVWLLTNGGPSVREKVIRYLADAEVSPPEGQSHEAPGQPGRSTRKPSR